MMYKAAHLTLLAILAIVPAALAIAPSTLAETGSVREFLMALTPILYAFSLVFLAGICSQPFHRAIQAGQFRRDLRSVPYAQRRLYGLCWTAVYYFTPIYFLFLSHPILKAIMFRLFGYTKNLEFTTYPDTWLRDLPLLDFGDGAYLSNRATIGTNVVLNNGDILVSGITIGKGGLVGHLAMLAPGARLGDSAEVGVGVAQGLAVEVEDRGRVGPSCTLNHGSRIGVGASIGTMSYVGLNAVIGPGIRIPAGALIPRDMQITEQQQVTNLVSSETRDLNQLRKQITMFMTRVGGVES